MVLWLVPIIVGLAPLAHATDSLLAQLPTLDEHSATGLQFHCSLQETNFAVGESINIWCAVTNTTDSIKPVIWSLSVGMHYCIVTDETNWMSGITPLVQPQLRDEIKVKPTGWSPENIFYLPPHSSVILLLTYKADRPQRFKGRLVYDPMTHGGSVYGDEALKKAKQACAFSNIFEYEVLDRVKK
jgi:hypothetical protein